LERNVHKLISDVSDLKNSEFLGEKGRQYGFLVKGLETKTDNHEVKLQKIIQTLNEL